MTNQRALSTNKRSVIWLLTSAVAISIWATEVTVPNPSGTRYASNPTPAQCEDAADVITALDRSRNGVSLTCNTDIVSKGLAQ